MNISLVHFCWFRSQKKGLSCVHFLGAVGCVHFVFHVDHVKQKRKPRSLFFGIKFFETLNLYQTQLVQKKVQATKKK